MFKFLPMLLGGLATLAGPMVGRILLALGMGYVTFKGFDILIGWLLTSIKTNMSGMPAETVNFLAYLWVDKAISTIFSAYTAAAMIKMAGSSSITKLITKSPAG